MKILNSVQDTDLHDFRPHFMIVSQLLGGNPEDLPPLIKIADKRKLKISFMLNRVLAQKVIHLSSIVSHSIILPINNLKSVKTKNNQ